MKKQTILNLKNIYTGYGKNEILHGITIEVIEGEIFAVIGPNGAGKSTLLKTAAGLLKPKQGQVLFDSKDITLQNCPQRVKEGIVYFMQGGVIFPELTVKENLEIGCLGKNKRMKKILDDILQFFPDIGSWLNKRAGLLSGGQRQQVALAMVLLKKPKILLLDEPSAGLAPNLVKEIIKTIQEINKTLGMNIVLIEQNVKEALKIADRASVMVNGQIKYESNFPEELLKNNILEKIYIME